MSNDLVTTNKDYVELVKETYCKGADNLQLQLFLSVCNQTGLDPRLKQIYAVFREDRKLGKKVMTIQTGIDGYRLIADRTGKYAPGKEPTFTYDEKGNIVSATAYIKKMTDDGTWHDISACAYYNEYVQLDYEKKPTNFWAKMPHSQLSKCAEALALRKAFPNHFTQLYVKEEMDQATQPEEEITPEQKMELYEIQREFPDLMQRALNALGCDKTIEDINAKYYQGIAARAKFMREKAHKETDKFVNEIALEYAQ